MSATSPLIRLAPLQPSELPAHTLLTPTDSEANPRPNLLPFTLALLDHAYSALTPMSFITTFESHSHKPAPPSNTNVEVLTATFPTKQLSEIKWFDPSSTGGVGRIKPREIPPEHWFVRRSYHANLSSKNNPATASWPEFVFGLRDNHSKNESEFTPNLYDARHILDWNIELDAAQQHWRAGPRGDENPGRTSYTHMTLAVYEMCHAIPFPLQPRCFPVLVATASASPTCFIAVTVPVNLSSFEGAFYSNGKNRTQGETSQIRKQVILGVYTAVEKCELSSKEKQRPEGDVDEGAQAEVEMEETIEWIMGTASDAKGNLPMMMQRSTMPNQVPKDVSYFLKWINKVDNAYITGEKTPEWAHGSKLSEGKEKRSSVGSAR